MIIEKTLSPNIFRANISIKNTLKENTINAF